MFLFPKVFLFVVFGSSTLAITYDGLFLVFGCLSKQRWYIETFNFNSVFVPKVSLFVITNEPLNINNVFSSNSFFVRYQKHRERIFQKCHSRFRRYFRRPQRRFRRRRRQTFQSQDSKFLHQTLPNFCQILLLFRNWQSLLFCDHLTPTHSREFQLCYENQFQNTMKNFLGWTSVHLSIQSCPSLSVCLSISLMYICLHSGQIFRESPVECCQEVFAST